MENFYNDELLPTDFEQIAKAYSQSLKKQGFVFVSLEQEEFNLLINEVFVLLAKMRACLIKLESLFECEQLKIQIDNSCASLREKFGNKKTHLFRCVEDENLTFLSLVSIENMLIIKLMLLSVKSGEYELCHQIITNISSIFAESFSLEGFVLDN